MTSTDDPAATAAAQDAQFSARLDTAIREFFAAERERVTAISPDATRLVAAIADLTDGGKRLRARLCHWGWCAAGGEAVSDVVVAAAASLELFQTAALIHDDVLDRSDTRRGRPSVHRVFEAVHRQAGWAADPEHFGVGAAVLTGDMSLSFAEQLFAEAAAGVAPAAGAAARHIFSSMRTEVMAGQYLDIHAEVAPPSHDAAVQLERAMTVLRYKSAKYSVEHPWPSVPPWPVRTTSSWPRAPRSPFPWERRSSCATTSWVCSATRRPRANPRGRHQGGQAHRADRALLRRVLPAQRQWLESVLGSERLTEEDVARVRDLMRSSGAHERSEQLIADLVASSDEALAVLPTGEVPRAGLRALADAAVRRTR